MYGPNMTSLILSLEQGCQIWHPDWVRLAPNGTNLGILKIIFSTFWLVEPICTERDLIILFGDKLTQFGWEIWHPWFRNITEQSSLDLIHDDVCQFGIVWNKSIFIIDIIVVGAIGIFCVIEWVQSRQRWYQNDRVTKAIAQKRSLHPTAFRQYRFQLCTNCTDKLFVSIFFPDFWI